MVRIGGSKVGKQRRTQLRQQHFPEEHIGGLWTGDDEKGFFLAPRSLPLVLRLINKLSDKSTDPTSVYLDLFSRHFGEGIVEMVAEQDHAYAAGYSGKRATRTWRDRMKVLEELGFIRVKNKGPRPYGYVLLIHPALAVDRLRESGRVPSDWWDVYTSRQMEVGETPVRTILKRLSDANAQA